MCVYDDTLFNCGASLRHLVHPCPTPKTCLPHIRWTDHQYQNCSECQPSKEESISPIFPADAMWLQSTNACGAPGYLLNQSRSTWQEEPSQDLEHLTGKGDVPPELKKGDDYEANDEKTTIAEVRASTNSAIRPMSESELSVQMPAVFDVLSEDEEMRDNELDDGDRKLPVEIVPNEVAKEPERVQAVCEDVKRRRVR